MKHGNYIGGEWTGHDAEHWINVENPYSRTDIGAVVDSDVSHVDAAVAAAAGAFDEWSRSPLAERSRILDAIADRVEQRVEEFAESSADEVGTPIRTARAVQTQLPVSVLRGFAELGRVPSQSEIIGNSHIYREPAGVVAAITPWNYPLHQVVCKLAPALLAGCTIVVKPSELAPLTVALLFDVLDDVGLPPGVVNLINGHGAVAGERLAGHPDVDLVSFTGSVGAGARVATVAAASVKRVTLELGGKSANVLLADAPVEIAAKVGVANAFLNAGQTCTAWTRMLVPEERLDEAVAVAVEHAEKMTLGDPRDVDTRIGPLASSTQADRVRGFIRRAITDGASVACGGEETPTEMAGSNFVAPTVLSGVDPDSEVAQEEVFGPVLSIIPFADESAALRIANNSKYGLHGSVWAGDPERAIAFARKMRTGTVDINGAAYNKDAPFGGYKQSGVGREMGPYGLHEFQEIKSIQV